MKKLLFLLSVALLSTASVFAKNANPAPYKCTLNIEYGIANPYYPQQGPKCFSGFGICAMTFSLEARNSTDNNANAYIQATADGKLDILMFRDLNQEALKGSVLKVEKDFEIPQIIVEQLQLSQKVIKAGSYTIRTVNNGKRITFN